VSTRQWWIASQYDNLQMCEDVICIDEDKTKNFDAQFIHVIEFAEHERLMADRARGYEFELHDKSVDIKQLKDTCQRLEAENKELEAKASRYKIDFQNNYKWRIEQAAEIDKLRSVVGELVKELTGLKNNWDISDPSFIRPAWHKGELERNDSLAAGSILRCLNALASVDAKLGAENE
jgi:hypothetical protein